MAIIPKINVETAQFCNLRQALQWLKDEIRPVDTAFEPILEVDTVIDLSRFQKERWALCAAIVSGDLPLFGEYGDGSVMFDEYNQICFRRYGDLQRLPIARIMEAGLDSLEFHNSRLTKLTAWWNVGGYDQPKEGWAYENLCVRTSELMRVFPADDPFSNSQPLPPIEIANNNSHPERSLLPLPEPAVLFVGAPAVELIARRTGANQKDAAVALHSALCAGDLIAEAPGGSEVPVSVWRSLGLSFVDQALNDIRDWGRADGLFDCGNAVLRTGALDFWLNEAAEEKRKLEEFLADRSGESETAAETSIDGSTAVQAILAATVASCDQWASLHLRFMNSLNALHGRKLAEWKKENVEAEIRARWRPELGEASQNIVGAMATLLRPLEARMGGAKRQRRLTGDGADREGWNRSPVPEHDTAGSEPFKGGTVSLKGGTV